MNDSAEKISRRGRTARVAIKATVAHHQAFSKFSPKGRKKSLWELVGLPASRGPELVTAIEKGLPVTIVIKAGQELSVTPSRLYNVLHIQERNRLRRKDSDKLTPEEGEKIARMLRVTEAAIGLFEGDRESAMRWLDKPCLGLNGKAPNDMLKSESGSIAVLDLINRLEHGVFA